MQNAAQAITIACSPLIFNNEVIAIPAIIYALMMNLILLAYVGMTKVIRQGIIFCCAFAPIPLG